MLLPPGVVVNRYGNVLANGWMSLPEMPMYHDSTVLTNGLMFPAWMPMQLESPFCKGPSLTRSGCAGVTQQPLGGLALHIVVELWKCRQEGLRPNAPLVHAHLQLLDQLLQPAASAQPGRPDGPQPKSGGLLSICPELDKGPGEYDILGVAGFLCYYDVNNFAEDAAPDLHHAGASEVSVVSCGKDVTSWRLRSTVLGTVTHKTLECIMLRRCQAATFENAISRCSQG